MELTIIYNNELELNGFFIPEVKTLFVNGNIPKLEQNKIIAWDKKKTEAML